MALDRFPHHAPHELPQRQVRVDVRQQPLDLLQPAPAVVVDHRLELPPPRAQRPYPVGRSRQLRVDPGQQLLYLPSALAGRLLHQRLPRRGVEHRRHLRFLRPLSGLRRYARRERRRAGSGRTGAADADRLIHRPAR